MTIPRGGRAAFESPLMPTEIADAPDIENVPAASSMHALMEAVTEIYHGVRQIQEHFGIGEQQPVVEVVDLTDKSHAEIVAEYGQENADFLAPDATPAPLDPSKVTVEIADWEDFRPGDVVVQNPDADRVEGAPFLVERHQPAPEPELADERIVAWERVARHPVLSAAHDGEGPLIDSVMAVLDRIADQPAPAPEPEPVWKPGMVGTAGTVRGLGYTGPVVRSDGGPMAWWTASPVAGAHWHRDSDVTDFVPDAPAPKVTRAQVFDVLYPDGIMPNEDMRDSKIDALMALFGGAS